MTLTIPQNTIINAKEYLVVKNDTEWMELENEEILLKDNLGNLIDRVGPFTELSKDSGTWQRYPNGEDNWRFVIKTPGKSNGGFIDKKPVIVPVEPFTISKFSVADPAIGEFLFNVNTPVKISTTVDNNTLEKQRFTYILKITNSDGATVNLSWIKGDLEPRKTMSLSQFWTPVSDGLYEIEIFIWESITNPKPLAFDVPQTRIIVS